MDLDKKALAESPKKIGTLNGKNVFRLRTKGGLHLIVVQKNQGYETIGTAPHIAVARHIAEKHEPDVVWSELQKSSHLALEQYEYVLPEYEELTERIRTIEREKDGQK